MDIYLLMAWRDARLVNPYDKPILVKEVGLLPLIFKFSGILRKKYWRNYGDPIHFLLMPKRPNSMK